MFHTLFSRLYIHAQHNCVQLSLLVAKLHGIFTPDGALSSLHPFMINHFKNLDIS